MGVPGLFEALYSGIEARVESAGRIAALLFKANLSLSLWLRRWLGLHLGKLLLRPLHQQVGPQLRIMACGGATLDPELAWKLEAIGWQVAIGYGLTETAPLLTLNPPGAAKIGTVGKPIPGVELRIDSSDSRHGLAQGRYVAPQLKHPSGEILARGPNVFAAYWNLPEKTAEAFTPDGWFRTGDLGFFDQEGYLHLTGRLSTLIVTEGGEKVQPDDVEEAYREATVISEIGVLQQDGKLVAVILPKLRQIHPRNEQAIGQAIREAVQRVSERLPSYQRISDFVLTRDSLARTRLGKIRRHLLAERYEQEKARRDRAVSLGSMAREEMPAEDLALLEDATAKQVWDLLAQRYAAKRLSLGTSPQLDLGIDSLEWLNLTLEIRRRAGVELSEEAIGRIATVRDLLREVSEAGAGMRAASLLEDPEQVLERRTETLAQAARGHDVRCGPRALCAQLGVGEGLVSPAGQRSRSPPGKATVRAHPQSPQLPRPAGDCRGTSLPSAAPDLLGRDHHQPVHRRVQAAGPSYPDRPGSRLNF